MSVVSQYVCLSVCGLILSTLKLLGSLGILQVWSYNYNEGEVREGKDTCRTVGVPREQHFSLLLKKTDSKQSCLATKGTCWVIDVNNFFRSKISLLNITQNMIFVSRLDQTWPICIYQIIFNPSNMCVPTLRGPLEITLILDLTNANMLARRRKGLIQMGDKCHKGSFPIYIQLE